MHMRTMPPFHATRAIAQTSRRSRRGLPPSRSPVLMRRSPPSTSSGAVVQAVRHSSLLYCTYFSSPVSRVSRISVILTSARAALRVALSSISRPRDPWDMSNSHFSACPLQALHSDSAPPYAGGLLSVLLSIRPARASQSVASYVPM